MEIIDGHSHLYQTFAPADNLKQKVTEISDFNLEWMLLEINKLNLKQLQTMPQEMTRKQGQWLGSNKLSADIQRSAPDRIIAFAAAEPLDPNDGFNQTRLKEVETTIMEDKLKGLLLTPPYGHYYSNDRRIYPFYEKAVELKIPIYFHHSHMFGPPKNCPLKYARIWLLDDLTIDFPELRFNVEHMGYPWTEELLSIMSRSPNVYTDISMFTRPYIGKGRPKILARNLGMAREYNVLDRVFYGSDYVGESIEKYITLLDREITYILKHLNEDMENAGFFPLNQEEMEGLLSKNVIKLWGRSSNNQ